MVGRTFTRIQAPITLLDMSVLDVDCGLEHNCCRSLEIDGLGHGGGGRLGTAGADGTFSDVLGTSSGVPVREITPAPIVLTGENKRGTLFKAVACGDYHSLGLTTEGTVFSWGVDFVGQLGDDVDNDGGATASTQFSSPPTPIVVGEDANDPVETIAASYTTSACVTKSGKLYIGGEDHVESSAMVNLMATTTVSSRMSPYHVACSVADWTLAKSSQSHVVTFICLL